MSWAIYLFIFISKVVENAIGTLRMIVVANGKKVLGAVLNGIIGFVWVIAAGAVIIDIDKDPWRIAFFILGSVIGSYIGSVIEEKLALGSNMLTAIVDQSLGQKVADHLREKGFAVTTMDGCGKEKERTILLIMVTRKKRRQIVNLIRNIDKNAMIVAESAFTIQKKNCPHK